MIIAIDHGNRSIKTASKTFTSGISESDTRPPFGNDILKFNGKYYSLTERRLPYARDKTQNENFYILTLFGIAFELEQAEMFYENDIIDVQLLCGLPPAHYGALYERFENYFIKDRQIVAFEFHDRPYEIYISGATAYPQAYAAAMTVYNQISPQQRVFILDLGGLTADYIIIKNGSADLASTDSLENGVIVLYNQIISKVNADYDLLIDESDIDAILMDMPNDFNNGIRDLVKGTSQLFIDDLFGKLRERMIDMKTCRTVFVGGGSMLLRKQIEVSGKTGATLFIDNLNANVKGYELLHRASQIGG